jgi:O-antigen/teichoic acid export membrane protein
MSNWLVLIAPLTVIVPFRYFVHAVAVGTHRVNLITVYDNLAKVLFAILLLVFWYTNIADLTLVLVANFITLILALFYILSRIPIRLDGFNATLLQVWGKTKSFGFHYFIGSASNQATYKLDEIIISYFISAAQTGLYSLAVVITSPLVLASQSLSQVLFKRFSTADKISKNTFLYNFIWLVAGYGGIILFVDQVVDFLFGAEFSQVTQYAYGIGIACIFQGLYQPFEFLSAKSEGKKIRNISIVEAVINVVGNIILIPIYGVWGAIYTSIVAKMIHLAGKYYYYRQYISRH